MSFGISDSRAHTDYCCAYDILDFAVASGNDPFLRCVAAWVPAGRSLLGLYCMAPPLPLRRHLCNATIISYTMRRRRVLCLHLHASKRRSHVCASSLLPQYLTGRADGKADGPCTYPQLRGLAVCGRPNSRSPATQRVSPDDRASHTTGTPLIKPAEIVEAQLKIPLRVPSSAQMM